LSTKILQQHWQDDDDDIQERDDEQLTVTVTVINTGDVGGAETVLFFTFDEFRSTTPEYKRLRGYEKVWLEPKESKEVSIKISLQDDLRFVGAHDDSHYILQDGLEFRVGIGSGSDCRNDGNLCSEVVTIRTAEDYVGACEAACNVWKKVAINVPRIHSCKMHEPRGLQSLPAGNRAPVLISRTIMMYK